MEKDYSLSLKLPAQGGLPDFRRVFDAEKLLRLNPNWFVLDLNEEKERFVAALKDYVSEERFQLVFRLDFHPPGLMRVEFEDYPVQQILFQDKGGVLYAAVTFDSAAERSPVDDTFLLWLKSIREYLRLHLRRNVVTWAFRWVMDHYMLKMNPSQRKISMMILKITVVEVLLILTIVVGYVLFMQ